MGKNVVKFLQVIRTTIKAQMNLNFKQNQPQTVELTALEYLENLSKLLQWEIVVNSLAPLF